jgi:hypothetical protein
MLAKESVSKLPIILIFNKVLLKMCVVNVVASVRVDMGLEHLRTGGVGGHLLS